MSKKSPFDLPLLPPPIDLIPLVPEIGKANYRLGRLNGLVFTLPNPDLLITPLVTKEAVLSSKIEGTQASLEDVFQYEAAQLKSENNDAERDIREIINYRKALKVALSDIKKRPIGENLIKKMHSILLNSVRGAAKDRGNFRRTQVFIGRQGATIDKATFVPPQFNEIPKLISNWEKFHHASDALDPLVRIAILHYQFEAIHPFLDGNGRVGRLLITLLLIEQNILPSPLLYLSAFFEATRNEYYRQLYNVSKEGSWRDWLIYFLNGVAVQSEDALSRAERINELLQSWKTLVASSNSSVAVDIVERLAVNPYITINKISADLQIAYSTAQRGIQKLETANIIQKTSTHKRDVVYCANAILSILEEPTRISGRTEE